MKSKLFMIDSCVWIEFFKNKNFKHSKRIEYLLPENLLCINGIILAEMLGGAKSEKEANLIKEAMYALTYLDLKRSDFEKSAHNYSLLRKKGLTIPLTDILIATNCIENSISLITFDKHFSLIAEHLKLKLELLDV